MAEEAGSGQGDGVAVKMGGGAAVWDDEGVVGALVHQHHAAAAEFDETMLARDPGAGEHHVVLGFAAEAASSTARARVAMQVATTALAFSSPRS